MDTNYAEKTGEKTIAIHCDTKTAELISEGICRIDAEFPHPCPANWKTSRRNLAKLKFDIEKLLPVKT